MRQKWFREAKINKNDEFYTSLSDIQKEMEYHIKRFKDKIVYCNCDDYEKSNFFKYFRDNFKSLGLKELVATCYDNGEGAKIARYDGVNLSSGFLKGNGDFRSNECAEILKEVDIVVTNPPFSLFRLFLDTLSDSGKKFLILGNLNSIGCKNTFRMIKENRLWLGKSIQCGGRDFQVPKNYPMNEKSCKVIDGKRYIRVKGVRWFTNMDFPERYSDFNTDCIYSQDMHPYYDNSDIIDVSRLKDIPHTYQGVMGVPITFIDKYNPEQFEILGMKRDYSGKILLLNGKQPYCRIIIRSRKL